jgi:hypothetical protein
LVVVAVVGLIWVVAPAVVVSFIILPNTFKQAFQLW